MLRRFLIVLLPFLALVSGCAMRSSRSGETAALHPALAKARLVRPEPAGPSLRLNTDADAAAGNPILDFMYFVPLISPEPVFRSVSAGNTQRARVVSITQHVNGTSFKAACEFEITGEGRQRNVMDYAEKVRRSEKRLAGGGALERQLGSITVEGAGQGRVEIEGEITQLVPVVTEVRLCFNPGDRPSPVTIGLFDIRRINNRIQTDNEMEARVNTLIFRRTPGPATMLVSLASLNRKGAGEGLWSSVMSGIQARAANLLIPPVSIESGGRQAMLDLGLAIASQASEFTFPRARNLQPAPIQE
ncbi:MAG: hypothetical protein NTX50_17350 [Candidatus Sumerlaeota bacterium]|nr:hypothetical protein [Candidatus Sumerlaeota bacterium]